MSNDDTLRHPGTVIFRNFLETITILGEFRYLDDL
jgi:hypothetical protein